MASVISKSAMTPSRRGRTARMLPGEDLVAAARVALDGDDRGLARDDALALDVDECVRGPEVDREIVREQAVQPVEDHRAVRLLCAPAAGALQGGGLRSP